MPAAVAKASLGSSTGMTSMTNLESKRRNMAGSNTAAVRTCCTLGLPRVWMRPSSAKKSSTRGMRTYGAVNMAKSNSTSFGSIRSSKLGTSARYKRSSSHSIIAAPSTKMVGSAHDGGPRRLNRRFLENKEAKKPGSSFSFFSFGTVTSSTPLKPVTTVRPPSLSFSSCLGIQVQVKMASSGWYFCP
eukprot:Pompholyxophrys_punicea_v1_NODE_118_length_3370_cov_2.781900.p2 type:complete len:187 gc:universal NODE_118_length_3370_cov_2.781900:2394-1834(-)